MGILADKIRNLVKLDFPYTGVRIVFVLDGKTTSIKLVDEQYSLRGLLVQTIELSSMDCPEDAEICSSLVAFFLKVENAVRRLIRDDNLELITSVDGLLQKLFPIIPGSKIA